MLRQGGDAEPAQEDFIARVAGGWRGGRLWGTFTDAGDAGLAVVQAITNLRADAPTPERRERAQARARELLADDRGGGFTSGSIARVGYVPLVGTPLLDAVGLGREGLGDEIASLARSHRLVPQSIGIESRVSTAGVVLVEVGGYDREPLLVVGADGAVVATFSVAVDDAFFGGMRVDPAPLSAGIARAGAMACAVWELLDSREAVQQVAVAAAILDAQSKVFGASTGRDSLRMSSRGLPRIVVAREPARVIRRAEVGGDQLEQRLVADVHRVFADPGAVES